MAKQWSLDSVAKALGYHELKTKEEAHSLRPSKCVFTWNGDKMPDSTVNSWNNGASFYLEKLVESEDSNRCVFDVGCGPGLFARVLAPLVKKYVGIDINDTCLKTCYVNSVIIKHEHPESDVSFLKQDIELEWKDEVKQEIEDCDVCYLNILPYLEDPKSVLSKLFDNFKWVCIDRVRIDKKTKKGSTLWSGMEEPTTLWTFDKDFFSDIIKNEGVTAKRFNHMDGCNPTCYVDSSILIRGRG